MKWELCILGYLYDEQPALGLGRNTIVKHPSTVFLIK